MINRFDLMGGSWLLSLSPVRGLDVWESGQGSRSSFLDWIRRLGEKVMMGSLLSHT